MPSLDIHIAIARKYLKKHKDIKNSIDFIRGNIAPDLGIDTKVSHYSKVEEFSDINLMLKNKVNLQDYLKCNKVVSDFDKGYFLHLLTDYLFYNNYIDKNYKENISFSDFKKNLYFTYNIIHDYLEENYDINYYPFEKEIIERISSSQDNANYYGEERIKIISNDKLDKFINDIIDIDINDYIIKLLSKTS